MYITSYGKSAGPGGRPVLLKKIFVQIISWQEGASQIYLANQRATNNE